MRFTITARVFRDSALEVKELRDLTRWPFVIILSTSVLLALVMPPEWIRSIPGMNRLIDLITDVVPPIAGFVKHSRFPDIASVYFPIMYLVSPLHLIWTWMMMPSVAQQWRDQITARPFAAFFKLLALVFLTVLIGGTLFLEGGSQLSFIPWNESRIALALAGYIASGGGFFMVVAALAFFLKLLIERIGARNG